MGKVQLFSLEHIKKQPEFIVMQFIKSMFRPKRDSCCAIRGSRRKRHTLLFRYQQTKGLFRTLY